MTHPAQLTPSTTTLDEEEPVAFEEEGDDFPPETRSRFLEGARDAWLDVRLYREWIARQALRVADILDEAQHLCPWDEWDDFLAQVGVTRAEAKNLLQIHRVGLDVRNVVGMGDLTKAARWASRFRLPMNGEVLAVRVVSDDPRAPAGTVHVWLTIWGHCAARLNALGEIEDEVMTRYPTLHEPRLWRYVWHLLEHGLSEISAELVDENTGQVWAALEARRLELNRATAAEPV